MNELIFAALFFVGTHLGVSSSHLRVLLVERLGESIYRVLYSVLAGIALLWLILAWRGAPYLPLLSVGPGLRHLPLLLMPVAILFVVCSFTQRNPTAIGARPDPDAREPATGIMRVTRHPFIWGVSLWAILHALAKGDQASMVFFGTFAALGLIGANLIDARRTRENAPGWGVYLQSTSSVPFLAIVQRRQRFAPREIGLGRLALALGIYVLLIWLHPWLFMVDPLS